MSVKLGTLSLFIIHLLILAVICWTWYDASLSHMSDFGLANEKHVHLQIVLIGVLSGIRLMLLFF